MFLQRPLARSFGPICALMISILMAVTAAQAANVMITNDQLWFDAQDKTPVQIMVEVKGANSREVANLLAAALGNEKVKLQGEASVIQRSLSSPLSIYDVNGEAGGGSLGFSDTEVRIEAQGLYHSDVVRLNKALRELKKSGLRGPNPDLPLAVQVRNLKGHDDFVSAISGLRAKTIRELEAREQKGSSVSNPVIFRYYLDDREKEDPNDFEELKTYQGDAIVSVIPGNTFGQSPLLIPGESVVFHGRAFHDASVLGKYNPGLINSNIATALSYNKYVESLFWEEYAPGAMPETRLLAHLTGENPDVYALAAKLKSIFPGGWVLKGVNESSSGLKIVTDKIDLVKEWETYKNGDFENFKAATYKKMAGFDEDNIYETLQTHEGYFGWRINQYLENPDNAIVQKKLSIVTEFRVDGISGRVLGNGSTLDRHNWTKESMGLPFEVSPPALIKRVEAFTQEIMNGLPPELREMNFAFDIAQLSDGNFAMIEGNAGSECGYIANYGVSVKALNVFLREYPRLVREGKLRGTGLGIEDQMKFLAHKFKAWNIDPKVHYKTFRFTSKGLVSEIQPVTVDAKYFVSARASNPQAGNQGRNQAGNQARSVVRTCQELFH
jgi:hypothetical protein